LKAIQPVGTGHGIGGQSFRHPTPRGCQVATLPAASGDQDSQRQTVVVDGGSAEAGARRVDVEGEDPRILKPVAAQRPRQGHAARMRMNLEELPREPRGALAGRLVLATTAQLRHSSLEDDGTSWRAGRQHRQVAIAQRPDSRQDQQRPSPPRHDDSAKSIR